MRIFKLAILFLMFYSSNLYANWIVRINASIDAFDLEFITTNCPIIAESRPYRTTTTSTHYVCEVFFESQFNQVCEDGSFWDQSTQSCSNDTNCPAGQNIVSINGRSFCSDLSCEGLGQAIASSYGSGGVCTEQFEVDDQPVSCGDNDEVHCFTTDVEVPDTFEPLSNGDGNTPDQNTLPQNNVQPLVNENVTTDTQTVGDTTVTTDTTQVTKNDGTTTTTTTETAINNTTGDSNTVTTVQSYDPSTGQTTTAVSGSSNESNPDEEGNSASGGSSCSAAPTCDGDAIQCAILHQQWLDRCPSTELLSDLEPSGFGEEGQDALDEVQQEYQDFLSQIRQETSEVFNISITGSGTITENPSLIRNTSVDFSLAKFSSQLSILGPIIIFIAYFAAFLILTSTSRNN